MRRVKSHRCASTHTPVIVNSVAVPLPPAGDNDNHQCRETKQDARGHALDERTEVVANQKADITDDPEDDADDTDDEQRPAQVNS